MAGMAAAIGRRAGPVPPAGEQVSPGSYTSYAEAQRVVDYLADHDFEVEQRARPHRPGRALAVTRARFGAARRSSSP
jgi:hypothetical protein